MTASAVVLGCGGFEANAQWRSQYLAPPWDHAKVRGTAHNQGDGLRMALAMGALPWGQWSGRHSTANEAIAQFLRVQPLNKRTDTVQGDSGSSFVTLAVI